MYAFIHRNVHSNVINVTKHLCIRAHSVVTNQCTPASNVTFVAIVMIDSHVIAIYGHIDVCAKTPAARHR